MMRIRNVSIVVVFILILSLFSVAHILLPDKDISVSERRSLAGFPTLSIQTILNGNYNDKLETYLLDHFPLREKLRNLKALWQFKVLQQNDNNGIYLIDGNVMKLDSVCKEDEIEGLVSNTNKVYESYLQDMDVYFAVIPDKNYFVAEQYGYPTLDYNYMEKLLADGLNENITYLGMAPFESLGIDDYYRTDLHWKQGSLYEVVSALETIIGFDSIESAGYKQNQYSPFYGSYYGQSALNVEPDTIVILTNETIENCVVTSPEYKGVKPVYDDADFKEIDGYNIFLGGPLGLVTIENPNGKTGRELIIFRDSFASSLAPLLLESYDKITLIDLRYLASVNIGRFVEFNKQDILFMYSTTQINNGRTLK